MRKERRRRKSAALVFPLAGVQATLLHIAAQIHDDHSVYADDDGQAVQSHGSRMVAGFSGRGVHVAYCAGLYSAMALASCASALAFWPVFR